MTWPEVSKAAKDGAVLLWAFGVIEQHGPHLPTGTDVYIPSARLREVRRILEAKLRLGLFDTPYVDEERARQVLDDPGHREVARVAAERSAVLLRNDGRLLPLDADGLDSVAVIGPLADSRRDILGPWVFDYDLDETVTVLDGVRRKAGDRVRVEYARGIPVAQRAFARHAGVRKAHAARVK